MAGLQVLAVLTANGKPASESCRLFDPFPQVLKNVRYQGTSPLDKPEITKAISDADKRLEGTGRVLIRKSGTEPLIRVMAEGEDETLVCEVVDHLVDLITDAAA